MAENERFEHMLKQGVVHNSNHTTSPSQMPPNHTRPKKDRQKEQKTTE